MTTFLAVTPVVGAQEIQRMFGVSRQRIQQIVNRADFPVPFAALGMGKVWKTEDVKRWAEAKGRQYVTWDGE